MSSSDCTYNSENKNKRNFRQIYAGIKRRKRTHTQQHGKYTLTHRIQPKKIRQANRKCYTQQIHIETYDKLSMDFSKKMNAKV